MADGINEFMNNCSICGKEYIRGKLTRHYDIMHSFHHTIVESDEWKSWMAYHQSLGKPLFDFAETVECGWISPQHWKAFVNFIKGGPK